MGGGTRWTIEGGWLGKGIGDSEGVKVGGCVELAKSMKGRND